MDNPWLKITKGNVKIATCDIPFFNKGGSFAAYIKKKQKVKLTFECLPDPFCGSPDSKVYCLNKNPGKPDPCFKGETAFENATLDNMQLKAATCFWAEKFPNKCGKLHDGVTWLKKRTMQLESILGRHPNIFFIEYFPYHSTNGFSFPKDLPSYAFTNELIIQAMSQNKLIILMREKKNWLNRIKDLDKYPLLVYLKENRGGYLTTRNLVWNQSGKFLTDDDIHMYF